MNNVCVYMCICLWMAIGGNIFVCRDTAGQERFHTITTSYYRGAMVSIICMRTHTHAYIYMCKDTHAHRGNYYVFLQGIMLVFDITKQKSFDNITKWIGNIEMVSVCNTYNILYYHIIISLFEYRLMLWVGLIFFANYVYTFTCLILHLYN